MIDDEKDDLYVGPDAFGDVQERLAHMEAAGYDTNDLNALYHFAHDEAGLLPQTWSDGHDDYENAWEENAERG